MMLMGCDLVTDVSRSREVGGFFAMVREDKRAVLNRAAQEDMPQQEQDTGEILQPAFAK
jgi:hypothetical protein